jgi:hypothetical protein
MNNALMTLTIRRKLQGRRLKDGEIGPELSAKITTELQFS